MSLGATRSLAIASCLATLQFSLFILGTVWLIQRGSPESKPVGSPHPATGVEG